MTLIIQCLWCGEEVQLEQGQTVARCRMKHVVHAQDHRRILDPDGRARMLEFRADIIKDFAKSEGVMQHFWIREVRLIDIAVAKYDELVEVHFWNNMIDLSDR